MPRTWELSVEDFSPRKPGRAYRAKVLNVMKNGTPPGLLILLQDLEQDQLSRQTQVVLPVPVRPAGTTADFMRACGLNVAVGKSINPRSAVGAIIRVRFGPSSEGNMVPIAFESEVPEELGHDK